MDSDEASDARAVLTECGRKRSVRRSKSSDVEKSAPRDSALARFGRPPPRPRRPPATSTLHHHLHARPRPRARPSPGGAHQRPAAVALYPARDGPPAPCGLPVLTAPSGGEPPDHAGLAVCCCCRVPGTRVAGGGRGARGRVLDAKSAGALSRWALPLA